MKSSGIQANNYDFNKILFLIGQKILKNIQYLTYKPILYTILDQKRSSKDFIRINNYFVDLNKIVDFIEN